MAEPSNPSLWSYVLSGITFLASTGVSWYVSHTSSKASEKRNAINNLRSAFEEVRVDYWDSERLDHTHSESIKKLNELVYKAIVHLKKNHKRDARDAWDSYCKLQIDLLVIKDMKHTYSLGTEVAPGQETKVMFVLENLENAFDRKNAFCRLLSRIKKIFSKAKD